MVDIYTAMKICIGMIVYYSAFQVYSNFVRAGMKHNTPNKLIASLRTEYKVNIRTFQKNNNLIGFAWFNSIWLNENLFRNKMLLLFAFHHEYYHVKHKHKQWTLGLRLMLSLLPFLLVVVHWLVFAIVILFAAWGVNYITAIIFEDSADKYAKEMTRNKN